MLSLYFAGCAHVANVYLVKCTKTVPNRRMFYQLGQARLFVPMMKKYRHRLTCAIFEPFIFLSRSDKKDSSTDSIFL